MSKPSENLIAARNVLIEDGWTKEVFHDHESGARCALGALDAVGVLEMQAFESQCLAEAIRETGFDIFPGCNDRTLVTLYNDDVAESPNDVLDIFDRAIVIAKEAEA